MCINIHSLFRYIENWAQVHLVSTNHLSDVLTTWPITQSTCAKLKPSHEVQETVYRPEIEQYWGTDLGKVQKNSCSIESPNEHSGLHKSSAVNGNHRDFLKSRLANMSDWESDPMFALTEHQCWSMETGSQPFLQHFNNQTCMIEWPEESHSVKGSWQPTWSLPEVTWRTPRQWEIKFSALIKQKLNSLTWMQDIMSGGTQAPLLIWTMTSL